MALILALETSTKVCSAAIFKDDQLLELREEGGAYSHAEKLAVFVEELLQSLKLETEDLDAVAIGKGPGSYTGLRIGTSLAKGLCFGLNIPLISIDTLKSMAWGAKEFVSKGDLLSPMIDARRMEVYTTLYDVNLSEIRPVNALVVEENSLLTYLEARKLYIFGDGAEKCISTINHHNLIYLENQMPSSAKMGALAFEKFQVKQFEDVAYYEPFYLKEFIALKGKKLV